MEAPILHPPSLSLYYLSARIFESTVIKIKGYIEQNTPSHEPPVAKHRRCLQISILRGSKHRSLRQGHGNKQQSMFSPPLLKWISVSKGCFLQLWIFQNILNWMNNFSNISTLIWIFIGFLFGIYIYFFLLYSRDVKQSVPVLWWKTNCIQPQPHTETLDCRETNLYLWVSLTIQRKSVQIGWARTALV